MQEYLPVSLQNLYWESREKRRQRAKSQDVEPLFLIHPIVGETGPAMVIAVGSCFWSLGGQNKPIS